MPLQLYYQQVAVEGNKKTRPDASLGSEAQPMHTGHQEEFVRMEELLQNDSQGYVLWLFLKPILR